jgi:hypothetical protein
MGWSNYGIFQYRCVGADQITGLKSKLGFNA